MQNAKRLVCPGRSKSVNPRMVAVAKTTSAELVGCCCRRVSVCPSVPSAGLSSAIPCSATSSLTLGVTCTVSLLFVEDGRFNGVEVCALVWDSAGISVAGKSPADGTGASPEHPRSTVSRAPLRPVLSSKTCS